MFKLYKPNLLLEDSTDSANLNLLLENKFKFSRKYDMERCDWEIDNNPIDWSLVPFGDPEWTFVLNRMDFCLDLCIETIKTKDQKYINKSKQLILDWISKNTEDGYHKWTRTLDSGIRLINWVECLKHFEAYNIIDNDEKQIILDSIRWQVKYIDEQFQNFQNFSNWGLMQSIGILNAATIVNTKLEKKYLEFLNQHLQLEFLDDGMQWEQSAIYILEVLVRLLQLDNDKAFTNKYYDILKRSSYPLRALTNVDGKTILIGDGDEVDTIGYLQRVSYLLKDQELLSFVAGYKLREEVYWQFGDRAVSYFANIPQNQHVKKVYTLDSAELISVVGTHNYFSFQNGNIGGGHGHFDNLHINYSYNDKKVLSDRGRYSYVAGSKERVELKARDAHNVLTTKDYCLSYRDAWNNDGLHFYSGVKHLTKGNVDYFYGLAKVDDKVTIRCCLLFTNGTLFVADYYDGEYCLNYHLDYSATVDDGYLINDELQFKVFNEEAITIEDTFIASVYNMKNDSKKLIVNGSGDTTISAFVPHNIKVEHITDFEHMYYDRILEYEKNIKLFKMIDNSEQYIIGIKLVDAGNVDNVVKYNEIYMHGSIFVHNLKTNQTNTFKY